MLFTPTLPVKDELTVRMLSNAGNAEIWWECYVMLRNGKEYRVLLSYAG